MKLCVQLGGWSGRDDRFPLLPPSWLQTFWYAMLCPLGLHYRPWREEREWWCATCGRHSSVGAAP